MLIFRFFLYVHVNFYALETVVPRSELDGELAVA